MLESRALRGAVAQLGERRVRNAKVEGSIPFRSTISLFLDDPRWSPAAFVSPLSWRRETHQVSSTEGLTVPSAT
jgi:hypothetical protein